MATGFCNDEARLCDGLNERAGYGRAGLGSEICGLREDLPEEGIGREMEPTRTPSPAGDNPRPVSASQLHL